MKMVKRYILFVVFALSSIAAAAQGWSVQWNAETDFLGGTGDYLPFWARTGRDGIVPYSSSALVTGGADVEYKADNGLYFQAGTNLVGNLTSRNPLQETHVGGIVDRLYVSGGWKMLHLDVGMKPRVREFGDLSITGGNFTLTGNARNMPGINAWSDWIYFEKGHWFGFRGNIAHYQMIDNRYVRNALVHNKSLAVKAALGRKVDLIVGIDHWAQWGGFSTRYGQQPSSFKDYIKVFFAQSGGDDATVSDQINVLGNHLGHEYLRVNWRAERFAMTFQYDMPFEDNGGFIKLADFPDGVWSLKFSLADRKGFVTDIIGEFIHTTWQAGSYHDRPATEEEMKDQDPNDPFYGRYVSGGLDNYFSNGEYWSGWTFYGRTLGLPLILPNAPGEDGIVLGIANNRVRGFHLGIAGNAFEGVPYQFKSTFTSNWGKYHIPETSFFYSRPWQLSLALELEFGKEITNLPMTLAVGAYGDIGKLYQNSFGLTLRIRYHDSRRF